MAKPTRAELLEAMKDPELLKELGIETKEDKEEAELFGDIEVGDEDTAADLVKKINARGKAQREWLKKREAKILSQVKDDKDKDKATATQDKIDKFLLDHPELNKNKELLDQVDQLYKSSGNLEEAYTKGCKLLDLDPETGVAPVEKKEGDKKTTPPAKEPKKVTSLKGDTQDTSSEDDDEDTQGKPEKPKSIREAAAAHSNSMAAEGKNPFRST